MTSQAATAACIRFSLHLAAQVCPWHNLTEHFPCILLVICLACYVRIIINKFSSISIDMLGATTVNFSCIHYIVVPKYLTLAIN